jgi:hypothetical protein
MIVPTLDDLARAVASGYGPDVVREVELALAALHNPRGPARQFSGSEERGDRIINLCQLVLSAISAAAAAVALVTPPASPQPIVTPPADPPPIVAEVLPRVEAEQAKGDLAPDEREELRELMRRIERELLRRPDGTPNET